jgi:[amino group carrier protein]-lysine/ornithine hydrolase
VIDWVNYSIKSDPIMTTVPETLLNLVQAYSPSGEERPAVNFLVSRMQALGYTRAFIDDAGNAVGVMGSGSHQIILLGHIDTVPGELPVHVSPASAGEGSGGMCLFGRGSVDAKGPLAAFTDAVAQLGGIADWQFVVIGAVEEERDSDGARYIASHYKPDFAIIGEPSRWDRVALGYKGSAWADVSVRREQAHTAADSTNACEAAIDIWQGVKAWAEVFNNGREKNFERLMLTLRALLSGTENDIEWARYRLGARLPLDLGPQEWYATLGELLKDAEDTSMQPIGFPIPAWQCEKNTPLVRAFLASIRLAGGTPSFVYKTGTADLNIVAPAWKCPALVYGPGDSSLDHTAREHLSLEEFARSVAVLTGALRKLTA